MRRKWLWVGSMILLLVLAGACAKKNVSPPAALQADAAVAARWQLAERLYESGGGNVKRSLRSAQGEELLELAAGPDGVLRYSVESNVGRNATASYDLQFLSTQGTGRISLEALDSEGQVLASRNMAFTGALLPGQQDRRYLDNYQGNWIKETLSSQEMTNTGAKAVRYRLSVEAGQGQHVLLRAFALETDWRRSLSAQLTGPTKTLQRGDSATLTAELVNQSGRMIDNAVLALQEPLGYGVMLQDGAQRLSGPWPEGEKRSFQWTVKAQRADAVNMNQPWPLVLTLNGTPLAQTKLSVADERPGEIFYVMTEDLEPMDAAGYPTAWGNQSGWLQPEEYRGQLIGKAEALNRIADKAGAKWTHYIAWPAVRAAEWAAERSAKNEWRQVVADIRTSVAQEAAKGHEYGVHMHGDYDPELPGNVLSYDPVSDGLWANHLKHGWSHLLEKEGTLGDPISRAGMLYRYQRILDQLTADSPQGQIITSRAGSFDFGNGAESEAASSRAYRAVGLWGSTDADGNQGGLTSGAYGNEIYLAGSSDINHPTATLADAALVEFRPTPRINIAYDLQSASVMNAKADEGMRYFAADGRVMSGVHGIIGFTHAMFVMGDGDWRSTSGGQFRALEEHLTYLKQRYVETQLLRFGTAGDLVRAYLDYYAPRPVVLYGQRLKDGWLRSEYALQILGRDIPVDAEHPHTVKVKYPLYHREDAFRVRVLKDGKPIYSTSGLPTPENDIAFLLDDKTASYTLEIWHQETLAKGMRFLQRLKGGK
ncbi:hypothetical protein [Azotosporobacter soli]|uniref:hypothetical protein n=1 Tax=Azotosporobacter soli TaxID=3055040 RepID=UPI0031FF2095